MSKHVDYIIVGGGISGCVLSYTLMKYGASVMMYDLPSKNMSSSVAAGLWNPIVLKRMKKVWRADAMINELHTVYSDMEKWTAVNFFDSISIRRVFHSAGEQNTWTELCDSPSFKPFLEDKIVPLPNGIQGNFKSGKMKNTGRLQVLPFIQSVHETLKRADSFIEECFTWDNVERDIEGVTYHDIRAHGIISCEGTQMALNAQSLHQKGFAPVKGELLRVVLDKPLRNECIHQKYFMLSEGDNKVTVGATYAWDGFEKGPTKEKRKELEEHLNSVWEGSFKTEEQLSGIRPATKDRKPIIGPHELRNTWVFGGMGSRAVLMAPYLAKVLVEHLIYGTDLLEECLPSRF
jgi:glycine/D-amino acid oxidase-like deaminating enzyme